MEYLPPILQKECSQFIGELIYTIHREKSSRRAKANSRYASEDDGDSRKVSNDMSSFLRLLIEKYMKRSLLKKLPDIETRIHDGLVLEGPESYAFPSLPGSHLEFKNPALEYIKTITAILELDKSLLREVRILKKDLLAAIHVREFSEEAKFISMFFKCLTNLQWLMM
jgi:DNA polymerase epsilon subunit 1